MIHICRSLGAASAEEVELGVLFLNIKEGRIFQLTLEELGHPQPPTSSVAIINPPWALTMAQ